VSDLLADVLDWCAEHPREAPLPPYGDLTFHREGDAVSVEGDVPDILAVSAGLLDAADSRHMSFTDGVLTIHVQPGPLRYRPLGPHPTSRVIAFRRIADSEPKLPPCLAEGGWIPGPPREVLVRAGERVLSPDMNEGRTRP
jgi:hypothetical protein